MGIVLSGSVNMWHVFIIHKFILTWNIMHDLGINQINKLPEKCKLM